MNKLIYKFTNCNLSGMDNEIGQYQLTISKETPDSGAIVLEFGMMNIREAIVIKTFIHGDEKAAEFIEWVESIKPLKKEDYCIPCKHGICWRCSIDGIKAVGTFAHPSQLMKILHQANKYLDGELNIVKMMDKLSEARKSALTNF